MAEIDVSTLSQKAERLRALHHTGRVLVLPNIWDPGGARMMESLGYPAVATASASIAYALGYDDGQQITLEAMLDVVGRVASSVHVPVTADMEWGYAEEPRSRFARSEEHTSELQSRGHLVCRLLLEKKKNKLIPLSLEKKKKKKENKK